MTLKCLFKGHKFETLLNSRFGQHMFCAQCGKSVWRTYSAEEGQKGKDILR